MRKVIQYLPLLLLAIVVASTSLYNYDWWAKAYPYVIQMYTAAALLGLLYYAVKNKHPLYLRIIYLGLIEINILNCMVHAFKIEHWMPYTVIVLLITVALVVYFIIRRYATNNKHPTS